MNFRNSCPRNINKGLSIQKVTIINATNVTFCRRSPKKKNKSVDAVKKKHKNVVVKGDIKDIVKE